MRISGCSQGLLIQASSALLGKGDRALTAFQLAEKPKQSSGHVKAAAAARATTTVGFSMGYLTGHYSARLQSHKQALQLLLISWLVTA